jgi:hypothetical protein
MIGVSGTLSVNKLQMFIHDVYRNLERVHTFQKKKGEKDSVILSVSDLSD